MASKPVAIIVGSQSDWATMKHAAKTSMTCDRLRGTNRFGAPDAQAAVRICQQRAQERVQGDYRRRRRRRPSPRDDRVNDPPAGLRRADEHPRLEGKDSLLSIMQMPVAFLWALSPSARQERSTRRCLRPLCSRCRTPRPPNGWTAGVRNRPDPSPSDRKIKHVLFVPCRQLVHSRGSGESMANVVSVFWVPTCAGMSGRKMVFISVLTC